ncbi:transmembrane protein 272-like [Pygocentrus nattereri]|uniref:Uncharacterized protein n=1 Tax=Pygocentrus nattereri TaxID=42514 RepID=A0AAR2IY06_PYGNA|nr:transmembrane protein 272-like [Pygocentrus nattereri]
MESQQLLAQMYNAHTQNVTGIVFSKLFLVAVPIIQIAISVVYLHDCPQQTYIPLYMIVSGVFGLLLGILSCLSCPKPNHNGGLYVLTYLCSVWNSLVTLFLFCWLIAGSVWIYSIYPANYNKTRTGQPYCNKTLYLSAFWTTTLVYILLAGLMVGVFCVVLCMCCSKQENTQREQA